MNEKLLVESFDVFLPLAGRMSDVLQMVAGAIGELTAGKYIPSSDAILCNAETGDIYNVNMAVAELGIRNGDRLMLI